MNINIKCTNKQNVRPLLISQLGKGETKQVLSIKFYILILFHNTF